MALFTDRELLITKLTGDYSRDRDFLMSESERMMKEGNQEGANAAIELLLEKMPEAEKKQITEFAYLDGKRLDAYYKDIENLISEKKHPEALPMAKALYEKITSVYKETDTHKFVCLRNQFEQNVCQLMFKTDKTLNVAPFDFSTMISTYGFLLVDAQEIDEAEVVLKKASEYNPVDCGPKFELAEAYKISGQNEKLLHIIRDTIKIASSPYALARCYANLGFYCVNLKDYDSAVAFYYSSIAFANHPAIPMELENIVRITGKPITPPKEKDLEKAFGKYNITRGPEELLVSVAAQLASQDLENNNITDGLMNLKILYGLTNDEQIKNIILKYEPDALEKAKERLGIKE